MILMETTPVQRFLIFIGLALFSSFSWSHPVIFKGGLELQGETQERDSMYSVTYTVHPRWAISAHHYDFRESLGSPVGKPFEVASAQVNVLVKRWLNHGSQGNIYAGLGAGSFIPQVGSSEFLSRGFVSMDWESTKYYVAGSYLLYLPDQSGAVDFKKLRAGFAPYILDQEGLNSWFIMEWRQMNRERAEVTPFLRFFHQSVLFELGSSLDGFFKFNFMIHY